MRKQIRARGMWSACAAVVGIVGLAAPAWAAQIPIALTADSFNENMVVGGDYSAPDVSNVTATMDGAEANTGYTWYQTNYFNGGFSAYSSSGLPMGTTITSSSDSSTSYTFQTLGTNDNAVLVTAGGEPGPTTATLTFADPAAYSTLSFMTASSGSTPLAYTINYVNSDTASGTVACPNWFSGTPSLAYLANGRVNLGGGWDSVQNDPDDSPTSAALYEENITVADSTDPIASITLSLSSNSNAHDVVMALSGTVAAPVPEPASLGLLAVGAAGLLIPRRRRA